MHAWKYISTVILKKKKKYQFNPRVYADSDGVNGFHVVPPVLGNKQDLESETVC